MASCGRRVSSVDEGEAEDGTWESKSSRFVTGRRLPAYSVGFFVGRAEGYRLPLYRTSGRALVALGLADTVTSSPYERQRALKASVEGGDFSPPMGQFLRRALVPRGSPGWTQRRGGVVRANYAGDNGSSADGAGGAGGRVLPRADGDLCPSARLAQLLTEAEQETSACGPRQRNRR